MSRSVVGIFPNIDAEKYPQGNQVPMNVDLINYQRNTIDLTGAHIGGTLNLSNSCIGIYDENEIALAMHPIYFGQDIDISQSRITGGIDLANAEIGGDLNSKSILIESCPNSKKKDKCKFYAIGASISGDLEISGRIEIPAKFNRSTIDGNVVLGLTPPSESKFTKEQFNFVSEKGSSTDENQYDSTYAPYGVDPTKLTMYIESERIINCKENDSDISFSGSTIVGKYIIQDLSVTSKKLYPDRDKKNIGLKLNLTFYPYWKLVEVLCDIAEGKGIAAFLWNKSENAIIDLDGTSAPIHELNAAIKLNLEPKDVENYLRFFCAFVWGDEGSFRLLESEN
jgi:hypothetical protein